MNEKLFITLVVVLSPLLVLSWVNILYLIFNRRKDVNQDLSLVSVVSLYLFSFVPLGLFVGYHIMSKKITLGDDYKYSKVIRTNGSLILIISIASTLFSFINLTK